MLKTPRETKPMIIPAKTTPPIIAITLFLKSRFKREAARVPVQAPVPGRGMPTNKNNAKYTLRPAFS